MAFISIPISISILIRSLNHTAVGELRRRRDQKGEGCFDFSSISISICQSTFTVLKHVDIEPPELLRMQGQMKGLQSRLDESKARHQQELAQI
ncbi:hypothetical protein LXL04_024627 [Taraxacum kok-saghyz]